MAYNESEIKSARIETRVSADQKEMIERAAGYVGRTVSDFVVGNVDVSGLIGKGIFKTLSDAAVFESVTVGKHGEVHWTDDLELCADSLYLQMTGKSVEDLFPNRRAHADA